MLKEYYQIIKQLFCILIINPRYFFKRIFLELKAFVLPLPRSSILKKMNGVLFRFDFDYSPNIKRMYFKIYEPGIGEILRTFLKEGDSFIDVGASIGYFSAIAAGCVGKNGEVHSFEPIPEYFSKLKSFAEMNREYKIKANQCALGDKEESKKIYIKGYPYIGSNSFFPKLLLTDNVKENKNKTAEVPIQRLDKYIKERKINNIKMIKIDVEGFEFPVLLGLERYFLRCQDTGFYPLIICEIIASVYPSLEYKLEDLFDYMKRFSYYPFEIINTKKRIKIDKIRKKGLVNVFFKFCKP